MGGEVDDAGSKVSAARATGGGSPLPGLRGHFWELVEHPLGDTLTTPKKPW